MTLLHQSLRSTCIVPAILLLAVLRIAADDGSEQGPGDLLSQHGIQPTAEGALAYLQRLKPDQRIQERVTELTKLLRSESYPVRERASRELTLIGEAAEPQLKAAAKSTDLEQAIRARQLLSLIQSRRDSDLRDSLLAAALQVLKHQKSVRTPTVLLDIFPLLENRYLHDAASEALWANVQAADEDRIRATLKNPHLPTRLAAIVALELAAGENSVDDLQEMLNDEDDSIRLAASRALMNQLPRQCLHTLAGLLACDDLEVRMQASWLLRDLTGQKFGDDGNEDFEAVVDHWTTWVEVHAEAARLRVPVGDQRLQLSRAMVVFRETFAHDSPSIKGEYGRFRYESKMRAQASVADGVLRFHGDCPETDQRLFVEAKNLTGGKTFPRQFLVKAKLTGEAGGSGAYHVGVSVGRIKVLFHPAYSGGGFRVETTDDHDYLISNQSMGFTPAANVMHEMALRVNKAVNGQVKFEAMVTNGSNVHQKYVKQFEFGSDVVGPLNRIGLERSGRMGGSGLFGPVKIDLSGKG